MLNNAGFEAYLVGGSVRDIVMGKAPGDADITTDALPRQTEKMFRNFKVDKTGIKARHSYGFYCGRAGRDNHISHRGQVH